MACATAPRCRWIIAAQTSSRGSSTRCRSARAIGIVRSASASPASQSPVPECSSTAISAVQQRSTGEPSSSASRSLSARWNAIAPLFPDRPPTIAIAQCADQATPRSPADSASSMARRPSACARDAGPMKTWSSSDERCTRASTPASPSRSATASAASISMRAASASPQRLQRHRLGDAHAREHRVVAGARRRVERDVEVRERRARSASSRRRRARVAARSRRRAPCLPLARPTRGRASRAHGPRRSPPGAGAPARGPPPTIRRRPRCASEPAARSCCSSAEFR